MTETRRAVLLDDASVEEPSITLVEEFESSSNRERRAWAEQGCDWAYFVGQFLRGQRSLDVQPSEIIHTQVYLRSDEIEQAALRAVCETEFEVFPSLEDERRLRERDGFIVDYVDGKTLGHSNFVARLKMIPQNVKERRDFDSRNFHRQYPSPILFQWIWGQKEARA